MPGTILVSVLEFLGLPFSSSPSTISIKVSMGKKEYQSLEKGEFSFPLTTLRETLVVVVQDEEGNEISYAGIETKSIVEKGLWDDIFPLEGGGKVHMKLQFVLNEDEKNRVRVIRESAMKKKQRGLLDCRTSSLERAANDGSNIASPLYHDNADKNEESLPSAIPSFQKADSNTSQVREPAEKFEARSLSADTPTKVVYSEESSSLTRRSELKKGASVENEESPSSAIPSPQRADFNTSQVNRREPVGKVEAQSLSADTPTNAVYSIESSSLTWRSELGSSLKKRASVENEESPSSAIPSPQRADFDTSQVSRREPVEKVEARSLSADTPTKAVFSIESSSSTRRSELGSSFKKRASVESEESSSSAIPSPQRADFDARQVNRREPVEKVEARSLSADTPNKAVYSKESFSSIKSLESGTSLKKQTSMENKESPSSAIPLPQRDNIKTSQVNHREPVEKVEARSLSADTPTKAVYSGSSSKKRASMERTPSSVKRMISAFENNPSQDIRPQAKPTPEKREVNKIGQEFETQVPGKMEEPSTKKVRGQGTDISPNSKLKLKQKEPDRDKDRPSEDLMRKPTIGTSLAAEKRLYELRQHSSHNVSSSKENSGDSSVVEENRTENSSKSPQSSTTRRTSTHKSTTVDDLESLYERVGISGAWIFPGHHRQFCVTTGGKKVMDFLEGDQSVKMSFSTPQKNNDDGDSQSEAQRSNETVKAEKSQPASENVESSRGLTEQVMKVAIMVGFGLLVLLTRQRNNR